MEKACGICSVVGHQTDMCPTFQKKPIKQENVAGGFPRQPQRKYDPYSSTYNSGWRDHLNLSYGNPQVNQPATQNHPIASNISNHIPLDNNWAKLLILVCLWKILLSLLPLILYNFNRRRNNFNKRRGPIFKV